MSDYNQRKVLLFIFLLSCLVSYSPDWYPRIWAYFQKDYTASISRLERSSKKCSSKMQLEGCKGAYALPSDLTTNLNLFNAIGIGVFIGDFKIECGHRVVFSSFQEQQFTPIFDTYKMYRIGELDQSLCNTPADLTIWAYSEGSIQTYGPVSTANILSSGNDLSSLKRAFEFLNAGLYLVFAIFIWFSWMTEYVLLKKFRRYLATTQIQKSTYWSAFMLAWFGFSIFKSGLIDIFSARQSSVELLFRIQTLISLIAHTYVPIYLLTKTEKKFATAFAVTIIMFLPFSFSSNYNNYLIGAAGITNLVAAYRSYQTKNFTFLMIAVVTLLEVVKTFNYFPLPTLSLSLCFMSFYFFSDAIKRMQSAGAYANSIPMRLIQQTSKRHPDSHDKAIDDEISNYHENARRAVHDILLPLKKLKSSIRHGNTDEAMGLIEQAESIALDLLPEKTLTPEPPLVFPELVLSSTISSYANGANISFESNSNPYAVLNVRASDFKRIIYNLLENSIQENPTAIKVRTVSTLDSWQLEITNAVHKNTANKIQDNLQGATSKETGSGLGISSVKKSVDKYHGKFEFSVNQTTASARVTFFTKTEFKIYLPTDMHLLVLAKPTDLPHWLIDAKTRNSNIHFFDSEFEMQTFIKSQHTTPCAGIIFDELVQKSEEIKALPLFPFYWVYDSTENTPPQQEKRTTITAVPKVVIKSSHLEMVTNSLVIDDDKYVIQNWKRHQFCSHTYTTELISIQNYPKNTFIFVDRWIQGIDSTEWVDRARQDGFFNIFLISAIESDRSELFTKQLGKTPPWTTSN